jgi:hypothetical protein
LGLELKRNPQKTKKRNPKRNPQKQKERTILKSNFSVNKFETYSKKMKHIT